MKDPDLLFAAMRGRSDEQYPILESANRMHVVISPWELSPFSGQPWLPSLAKGGEKAQPEEGESLHDMRRGYWKYFKEMNEAYGEFFERNPPARSTVQGDRWPEGHLVAIEAIALVK